MCSSPAEGVVQRTPVGVALVQAGEATASSWAVRAVRQARVGSETYSNGNQKFVYDVARP